MAWTNVKMNERDQVDGIGILSMEWVIEGEVICSYSGLIKGQSEGDRDEFKKKAEKHKTECEAKHESEDKINTEMTEYMNN